MCAAFGLGSTEVREGYVRIGTAALYYRDAGEGQPIVVLHGGPDFDHAYLLPEVERLADSFWVISYDQRGRGRSAANVLVDDVSLASDVDDLDRLREHLGLETMAVLGHSWGGLLALEYAIHHPERVSRLILMNSAPVSRADRLTFREERARSAAGDLAEMLVIASTPAFAEGDPDAVAAYYRIHFRAALRRPEHVHLVVERLRTGFTREGILLARAIENRLEAETALSDGYDLLPALERLDIPALVLHGDRDFAPVEIARHIAAALPQARFVLLPECGHFSYLERPEDVRGEIVAFMGSDDGARNSHKPE